MKIIGKIIAPILILVWWIYLVLSWFSLEPIVLQSRWIYILYGGLFFAGLIKVILISAAFKNSTDGTVWNIFQKFRGISSGYRQLISILLLAVSVNFIHYSKYSIYLDTFQIKILIVLSLFIWLSLLWERSKTQLTSLKTTLISVSLISVSFSIPSLLFSHCDHPVNPLLMVVSLIICFPLLMNRNKKKLVNFKYLLGTSLIVSVLVCSAVYFQNVSSHPFSLGWSEGNRLWDYSVFFGSDIYDVPEGIAIKSLTDEGRQIINGLPFLFGNDSIFWQRFWNAFSRPLLYGLLSLAAFYKAGARGKTLLLASLWGLIFVDLGPIHLPLIAAAIAVVLAWGSPLWAVVSAAVLSTAFINLSRYTWIFAPTIWTMVLALSWKKFPDIKFSRKQIKIAGAILGIFSVSALMLMIIFNPLENSSTIKNILNAVDQGLIWSRLLPNATSGPGVVLRLIFAVSPLLLLIWMVLKDGAVKLNKIQTITLVGAQSAFLVVGLIISTKIGGGGDLHNLDMFLIGMLFTSAIFWKHGAGGWIMSKLDSSKPLQLLLLVMALVPGFYKLNEINPLQLCDLNEVEVTNEVLHIIEREVEEALNHGDVLFSDQRQLLTFGFIDAPLVVKYEKKVLMEYAMNNDQKSTLKYYTSLGKQEFSLIVAETLYINEKDSDDAWGEENNAWVKNISAPTLCFYEPIHKSKFTQRYAGIMLLAPNPDNAECWEKYLPGESP